MLQPDISINDGYFWSISPIFFICLSVIYLFPSCGKSSRQLKEALVVSVSESAPALLYCSLREQVVSKADIKRKSASERKGTTGHKLNKWFIVQKKMTANKQQKAKITIEQLSICTSIKLQNWGIHFLLNYSKNFGWGRGRKSEEKH